MGNYNLDVDQEAIEMTLAFKDRMNYIAWNLGLHEPNCVDVDLDKYYLVPKGYTITSNTTEDYIFIDIFIINERDNTQNLRDRISRDDLYDAGLQHLYSVGTHDVYKLITITKEDCANLNSDAQDDSPDEIEWTFQEQDFVCSEFTPIPATLTKWHRVPQCIKDKDMEAFKELIKDVSFPVWIEPSKETLASAQKVYEELLAQPENDLNYDDADEPVSFADLKTSLKHTEQLYANYLEDIDYSDFVYVIAYDPPFEGDIVGFSTDYSDRILTLDLPPLSDLDYELDDEDDNASNTYDDAMSAYEKRFK